jgi:hypothetical protein
MQAETIENIWHFTKCIDLLKGQKIIEIDSEASVTEGCEVALALKFPKWTNFIFRF